VLSKRKEKKRKKDLQYGSILGIVKNDSRKSGGLVLGFTSQSGVTIATF
jgi:hypothetical protein